MPGGGKVLRSIPNNPSETGLISEEQLETLMTRVCSNFVKQLESKIDNKFDHLEKKLTDTTAAVKCFEQKINSHENAIASLTTKNDYSEQIRKRNNLCFHGLLEGENEDILVEVVNFINVKLKVPCEAFDIDCAFRIGRENSKKPRGVLVSFVRNIKRNEVFNAKRYLKGTKFSIYEDLTSKNYELLGAAKRELGRDKAWSVGGKVYVWSVKHNKKMLIKSIDDICT